MNIRKVLSLLLTGIMLAGTALFGGCAKSQTASSQATASKADSASSVAPIQVEPIRFFMGTAGLNFPEGTTASDNVYIKKIAELAKVEFTEVICPEYSDFQTKFNLMFSSNDIPDLVHSWYPADVQTQGEAGAFMELSDIISSSAVLSKTYTKSMVNLMKNEKDHIFALRAQASKDGLALGVNIALLDELNNGVVPTDPDGWYALMKKEKEKYPDSVPLSGRTGLRACDMFFKAYGVSVTYGSINWQYKDNKIIHAFEAPMMKDAITYYQKLYQEGILDKTFVTNAYADWADRKDNKNMLLFVNNTNSCIDVSKNTIPAALPRVNDSRVTDNDAYLAADLLGNHNFAISSKTQHKDAVVRLIETFFSDDVKLLSSWGIEGTDFTVSNNVKTVTEAGSKTLQLRSMYRMMWNYGNEESVAMNKASIIAKVDASKREEYSKRLDAALDSTYAQQAKAQPDPVAYIQLSTATQTKLSEASEASKTILIKAIIGEITMDQYDTQVAAFLEKYKAITDEYNAKLPTMLEKLKG